MGWSTVVGHIHTFHVCSRVPFLAPPEPNINSNWSSERSNLSWNARTGFEKVWTCPKVPFRTLCSVSCTNEKNHPSCQLPRRHRPWEAAPREIQPLSHFWMSHVGCVNKTSCDGTARTPAPLGKCLSLFGAVGSVPICPPELCGLQSSLHYGRLHQKLDYCTE